MGHLALFTEKEAKQFAPSPTHQVFAEQVQRVLGGHGLGQFEADSSTTIYIRPSPSAP